MRRGIKVVVGSIAVVVGLYGVALAGMALAQRPAPSDVAVVLGNAVSRDGRPVPRLRARLDEALRLYQAGTVRRVLVSGGVERGNGMDEAAVMARYLRTHGVPESAILQDPKGTDTMQTARNTVALLGPDARVVVVSQWFHLPRTMLALRTCGIARVSAAWPRWFEARDAYSFAREMVAVPSYAIRLAGGACARGS